MKQKNHKSIDTFKKPVSMFDFIKCSKCGYSLINASWYCKAQYLCNDCGAKKNE